VWRVHNNKRQDRARLSVALSLSRRPPACGCYTTIGTEWLCIYIRSAFIHFDLWPVLFAFLSDTSSFPRPKFWFGSSVASVSKAAEYKKQVIRGTRNNNLWGKRYLAQDATDDLSRLDVLCCGILYQRDCRVHGSSLKKVSRCRFGGSLYIILSRSTGILNDGDIHRSIRHDYRDWTYIDDIHYLSSLLFFMFFIFIWSGFPWWPGHSPARINKKRRRGKGGGDAGQQVPICAEEDETWQNRQHIRIDC
jgi:hypothetical protein